MAHHNNTPESVLKAPARTFGFVVEHTGIPRRERRHAFIASTRSLGERDGTPKDVFIPKHRQAPALNTPYRRPARG